MFGGLKGVDEATLVGIVSDLYPDPSSLRDLARRAGLRSDHVTKGASIGDNSRKVVYAAGFSGFGGVPRLLMEMSADFPEHPYLNAWVLGTPIAGSPHVITSWEHGPPAYDERRPILMHEWLASGIRAGAAVVRIDLGEVDGARCGTGTGIVVDGVWLITPTQYIGTPVDARRARIEFLYEAGGKAHYRQRLAPGDGFAVDPSVGLSACCITGGAQPAPDYSMDNWKEAHVGQPCQVIGHPAGMHKTIIPYGCTVSAMDENRFWYTSYGMPATEGSPVFDEGWGLLGITVSSGWRREPYPLYGNIAVHSVHINTLLEQVERGHYGTSR